MLLSEMDPISRKLCPEERYLVAQIRISVALVRERRIIHNVPVKYIEFIISHGILQRKKILIHIYILHASCHCKYDHIGK